MAVRRDAIARNLVREVADLPRNRQKPRAADLETSPSCGPNSRIGWTESPSMERPATCTAPDATLGSSTWPTSNSTPARAPATHSPCAGDVDLHAHPPRITLSGTIVRIKGKGPDPPGMDQDRLRRPDRRPTSVRGRHPPPRQSRGPSRRNWTSSSPTATAASGTPTISDRPKHPASPQPWDASRGENVSFAPQNGKTRVELVRSPWSQLPHLDSNQKPADYWSEAPQPAAIVIPMPGRGPAEREAA